MARRGFRKCAVCIMGGEPLTAGEPIVEEEE